MKTSNIRVPEIILGHEYEGFSSSILHEKKKKWITPEMQMLELKANCRENFFCSLNLRKQVPLYRIHIDVT